MTDDADSVPFDWRDLSTLTPEPVRPALLFAPDRKPRLAQPWAFWRCPSCDTGRYSTYRNERTARNAHTGVLVIACPWCGQRFTEDVVASCVAKARKANA